MNRTDNTARVPFGCVYYPEIVCPDGTVLAGPPVHNLVPTVGVQHLVGLVRGTGTVIPQWYIGLYEGNFVPSAGTTAADLQSLAGETQVYSELTRPVWADSDDGAGSIDNFASRAEFTFTADRRVYGAFLVSDEVKGGNSGTLLSIARFPSPYDVPAGAKFRLGVALDLIPEL